MEYIRNLESSAPTAEKIQSEREKSKIKEMTGKKRTNTKRHKMHLFSLLLLFLQLCLLLMLLLWFFMVVAVVVVVVVVVVANVFVEGIGTWS